MAPNRVDREPDLVNMTVQPRQADRHQEKAMITVCEGRSKWCSPLGPPLCPCGRVAFYGEVLLFG